MLKEMNKINQGLILSSVFIIIFLISIFTPIGFITIYFAPIPFIIFSYLNETKSNLLMILFNIAIVSLVGGVFGLFLGLFAGSVGIIMGILYKKGNVLQAYVGGIIIAIINFILLLFISDYFFDIHIIDSIKQLLFASLESTKEVLQGMGTEEQFNQFIESYSHFINTIEQLLPLFIILYSILIVSINHFFGSRIMRKFDIQIPKFPPIRNWMFPKSIIFYYLIAVLITVIKPLNDIYTLKIIALNLYPLLQLLLIIQGVSFVFYYAHRKNWGKTIKIFTIIGLFIPLFSQVLQFIGLFDIGFDLRKKLKA